MKPILLKVPEGMLELWKESAVDRKMTLSQLIREAVNRDIERAAAPLRDPRGGGS
jgi:hypothetical protein